jgi:hypothetical protein
LFFLLINKVTNKTEITPKIIPPTALPTIIPISFADLFLPPAFSAPKPSPTSFKLFDIA